MERYQCCLVDGTDECQVQRLHCASCELLLNNPVQNIKTGQRFCRSCIDTLMTMDEYRSDKAILKEMMTVKVRCQMHNKSCKWQGTLESFNEDHSVICSRKHSIIQENMQLKEDNSKIQSQLQEYYSKLNPSNEEQILESEETNQLVLSQTPLAATFKLNIKPGFTKQQQSESFARITKDTQPAASFASTEAMSEHVDDEFDKKFTQLQNSAQTLGEKVTQFNDEIQSVNTDINKFTKESKTLFNKIATTNQCNGNHKFKTHKFYSIHKEKSTNGSCDQMQCVLQIPNIHTELLPGTCEEPNFIFTPKWYAKSGHQFQGIISLVGCEECLGTHVSAFAMPVSGGKDDNTILWPVTGLMTINLLHPDEKSQEIIKCFQLNCSFNKPLSFKPDSENIVTAIGCLDFIPKQLLFDMRYVKNGTMRWGFEFKHK